MEEAKKVLHSMKEYNIELNEKTFSILMNGYAECNSMKNKNKNQIKQLKFSNQYKKKCILFQIRKFTLHC